MALKRIIGLLLSAVLLAFAGVAGLSADQQNATITTTVPESYYVTVLHDENGEVSAGSGPISNGGVVAVSRGASQSYTFRAKPGCKLVSVAYNGQDVTAEVVGGAWTAPAITKDSTLSVSFAKGASTSSASNSAASSVSSSASSRTQAVFTLVGKVSINGTPLANAVLELTGEFGTLTARTDSDGNYRFDNVPAGPHNLTVTSGGKKIGNAEFNLTESSTNDLKAETDEKGTTSITVGKDIKILEIDFAILGNGKVKISAQLPPEGQQVPYTGVLTVGYLIPISVICALLILVLVVFGKRKKREE